MRWNSKDTQWLQWLNQWLKLSLHAHYQCCNVEALKFQTLTWGNIPSALTWLMRFLQGVLWILLFCSMVSCGTQGCSWEKASDNRELNKHCTSCSFFRRSSVLAQQKRLEHVRNAASANLVANMSAPVSWSTSDKSEKLELVLNLSIENLITKAFQWGCTAKDSSKTNCPFKLCQAPGQV